MPVCGIGAHQVVGGEHRVSPLEGAKPASVVESAVCVLFRWCTVAWGVVCAQCSGLQQWGGIALC